MLSGLLSGVTPSLYSVIFTCGGALLSGAANPDVTTASARARPAANRHLRGA
jgi:hypothetical protein